MIEVKIVADSMSKAGKRITTFVLTYPRFIHAEFMTHRVLSRNASSSRAIPVKKQIAMVRSNMVIPIHIGANRPGMQAKEEVSALKKKAAVFIWKALGHTACIAASILDRLGVHKQVANRVLEPWNHITVVVTATEWDNFFALRVHPDAQPEIHALAAKMYDLYSSIDIKTVNPGYWHLPFMDKESLAECSILYGVSCVADEEEAMTLAIKRSVARCARVSYMNHDGTKSTIQQDLDLYQRLLGNTPIHASPSEHQAMAMFEPDFQSGNFRGWMQYRKTIPNENIDKYEIKTLLEKGCPG